MGVILGDYKLKDDKTFRCGVSIFTMRNGSVIKVLQVDKEYRKVLICFGGRDVDWFSDSIMKYLEMV